MLERHKLTAKTLWSGNGEEHEAFAIGRLQKMIARSEALKMRRDYADAIRRLETGAACATLRDAAWALANL
jgi:hypothetical protein